MTRADALRDLIARVEAGSGHHETRTIELIWSSAEERYCVEAALWDSSLDAVARLEAPLRERGWEGPSINPPQPSLVGYGSAGDVIEEDDDHSCLNWQARWCHRIHDYKPGSRPAYGESLSEARARLLAVLRALLSEEPRDPA